MTTNPPAKREHGTSRNNRRNKKRRYKQYSNTVSQKDLGKGSRGFLISCTPKNENQCFRDALVLFDRFVDTDKLAGAALENKTSSSTVDNEGKDSEEPETKVENVGETSTEQTKVIDSVTVPENSLNKETKAVNQKRTKLEPPVNDLAAELAAELSELKSQKNVFFEHVDMGARGSVFVRVRDTRIDLEDVVERVMVSARESGSPGCRFCQKILPIHSTCYASPTDATSAAISVVEEHFPEGNATYGIEFKHRVNTGAHRKDYIPAIGNAITEKFGSRFTVNLNNPDVVLIVEVVKTSCCIGVFRRYRELGKLNVREAAKPMKVRNNKEKDSTKDEKVKDVLKEDRKSDLPPEDEGETEKSQG